MLKLIKQKKYINKCVSSELALKIIKKNTLLSEKNQSDLSLVYLIDFNENSNFLQRIIELLKTAANFSYHTGNICLNVKTRLLNNIRLYLENCRNSDIHSQLCLIYNRLVSLNSLNSEKNAAGYEISEEIENLSVRFKSLTAESQKVSSIFFKLEKNSHYHNKPENILTMNSLNPAFIDIMKRNMFFRNEYGKNPNFYNLISGNSIRTEKKFKIKNTFNTLLNSLSEAETSELWRFIEENRLFISERKLLKKGIDRSAALTFIFNNASEKNINAFLTVLKKESEKYSSLLSKDSHNEYKFENIQELEQFLLSSSDENIDLFVKSIIRNNLMDFHEAVFFKKVIESFKKQFNTLLDSNSQLKEFNTQFKNTLISNILNTENYKFETLFNDFTNNADISDDYFSFLINSIFDIPSKNSIKNISEYFSENNGKLYSSVCHAMIYDTQKFYEENNRNIRKSFQYSADKFTNEISLLYTVMLENLSRYDKKTFKNIFLSNNLHTEKILKEYLDQCSQYFKNISVSENFIDSLSETLLTEVNQSLNGKDEIIKYKNYNKIINKRSDIIMILSLFDSRLLKKFSSKLPSAINWNNTGNIELSNMLYEDLNRIILRTCNNFIELENSRFANNLTEHNYTKALEQFINASISIDDRSFSWNRYNGSQNTCLSDLMNKIIIKNNIESNRSIGCILSDIIKNEHIFKNERLKQLIKGVDFKALDSPEFLNKLKKLDFWGLNAFCENIVQIANENKIKKASLIRLAEGLENAFYTTVSKENQQKLAVSAFEKYFSVESDLTEFQKIYDDFYGVSSEPNRKTLIKYINNISDYDIISMQNIIEFTSKYYDNIDYGKAKKYLESLKYFNEKYVTFEHNSFKLNFPELIKVMEKSLAEYQLNLKFNKYMKSRYNKKNTGSSEFLKLEKDIRNNIIISGFKEYLLDALDAAFNDNRFIYEKFSEFIDGSEEWTLLKNYCESSYGNSDFQNFIDNFISRTSLSQYKNILKEYADKIFSISNAEEKITHYITENGNTQKYFQKNIIKAVDNFYQSKELNTSLSFENTDYSFAEKFFKSFKNVCEEYFTSKNSALSINKSEFNALLKRSLAEYQLSVSYNEYIKENYLTILKENAENIFTELTHSEKSVRSILVANGFTEQLINSLESDFSYKKFEELMSSNEDWILLKNYYESNTEKPVFKSLISQFINKISENNEVLESELSEEYKHSLKKYITEIFRLNNEKTALYISENGNTQRYLQESIRQSVTNIITAANLKTSDFWNSDFKSSVSDLMYQEVKKINSETAQNNIGLFDASACNITNKLRNNITNVIKHISDSISDWEESLFYSDSLNLISKKISDYRITSALLSEKITMKSVNKNSEYNFYLNKEAERLFSNSFNKCVLSHIENSSAISANEISEMIYSIFENDKISILPVENKTLENIRSVFSKLKEMSEHIGKYSADYANSFFSDNFESLNITNISEKCRSISESIIKTLNINLQNILKNVSEEEYNEISGLSMEIGGKAAGALKENNLFSYASLFSELIEEYSAANNVTEESLMENIYLDYKWKPLQAENNYAFKKIYETIAHSIPVKMKQHTINISFGGKEYILTAAVSPFHYKKRLKNIKVNIRHNDSIQKYDILGYHKYYEEDYDLNSGNNALLSNRQYFSDNRSDISYSYDLRAEKKNTDISAENNIVNLIKEKIDKQEKEIENLRIQQKKISDEFLRKAEHIELEKQFSRRIEEDIFMAGKRHGIY